MAVPVVAIVGRPNVGKSSLFNWLAGRRIAIVDPTAGVTRDRVSTLIPVGGRFAELTDTGGIGGSDNEQFTDLVQRQIDYAIAQAHVILFVVDVRSGLMPLDEEVVRRLRAVTKPVLLVANKADTPNFDLNCPEFYRLGLGEIVCVSAQENRNRDELLRRVEGLLPPPGQVEEAASVTMKLAVVGRRNTGKSTFVNSVAREERLLVSEIPGTTRDSVDVRIELDGKTYILIDTAGVRKKRSLAGDLEFYSLHRAERSIRRADVVLLFLDPQVRISKVDKQLAEYILENHKPAIFVVNKWDLMVPMPTGQFGDYVRATFPSLDYLPIAFITGKDGRNLQALLNLARNLHKQASARVGTGDLNRVLREALAQQAPPLRQNRRAKVYYATQVAANPPTLVLFTNGPELFDNTYIRYLLKFFRDRLPFREVPIKLYLRDRNRGDQVASKDLEEAAVKPEPRRRPQHGPKPRKEPARGRGAGAADVWKDL